MPEESSRGKRNSRHLSGDLSILISKKLYGSCCLILLMDDWRRKLEILLRLLHLAWFTEKQREWTDFCAEHAKHTSVTARSARKKSDSIWGMNRRDLLQAICLHNCNKNSTSLLIINNMIISNIYINVSQRINGRAISLCPLNSRYIQ